MSYHHLCEEALIRHNSDLGDKGAKMRQAPDEHCDRGAYESTATPSESSKVKPGPRWADMSSDDEEQDVMKALPSSSNDALKKPRWADMFGDDGEDEEGIALQPFHQLAEKNQPADDAWFGANQKKRKQKKEMGQVVASSTNKDHNGWTVAQNANKQVATSSRRGGRGRNHGDAHKLQCQWIVGIEEDKKFGVVRKILGPKGENMKRVVNETGVKLRLRGRGSKFLEGPENKESTDPLMLCLSAPSSATYSAAVTAVEAILNDVYAEYKSFCARAGLPRPEVGLQFHEGARDGAR